MDNKHSLEIRNKLLTGDADAVLDTCHEILHMATMDIKKREELLDDAYKNLDEIKKHAAKLDYGGAILKNSRFVDKALLVIEQSKDGECKCVFAFEKYGTSAKVLSSIYGFNIHKSKVDGYVIRSIVECPCCHSFYETEDEYTGWFMNSFRFKKIDYVREKNEKATK